MIFIAYQTEFTVCKRLLSIYANEGGTACVRVRRTDTYEVVKEVSGVGTEEALELYEELFNCMLNARIARCYAVPVNRQIVCVKEKNHAN